MYFITMFVQGVFIVCDFCYASYAGVKNS